MPELNTALQITNKTIFLKQKTGEITYLLKTCHKFHKGNAIFSFLPSCMIISQSIRNQIIKYFEGKIEGAGVKFDLTFFDNWKLIDFGD